MNRTLINNVRTKFIHTKFPKFLWGEAILSSTYESNRSPTHSLPKGKTPTDYWYGEKYLSRLKVFGCKAWFLNLSRTNKLKANAVRFVGYCGGGYRVSKCLKM